MPSLLRFLARRLVLGMADQVVTAPPVRWIWSGQGNEDIIGGLRDFLPTDRDSAIEMRAGRYLLASKLVDTGGVSPFDVDVDHDPWLEELHTFGWLRHFSDARNDEDRYFARDLVLDWIGRYGKFDRTTWALSLCSRRVLNWLRHYNLLVEGATPEETTLIDRALVTQIQSLRLRGPLATEPLDALLAAIALCGVALCEERRYDEIPRRVSRVDRLLARQIGPDGLHLSRSAAVQVMLLVELTGLKYALGRYHDQYAQEFDTLLERMHRALDAVSLGTGEAGYFNGTGQLPHDVLFAIQGQNPSRMRQTGTMDGYGRLIAGPAIVVADSGQVPPPDFALHAHAGALSFEFSHGRDLIVGNCGPAPSGMENPQVFREGGHHSGPTINGFSADTIRTGGAFAGRLIPNGTPAQIIADPDEDTVVMRTHGFADRFGVVVERRLTLLAGGKSLVGQDRFLPIGSRVGGTTTIRFHLAPLSQLEEQSDLIRIRCSSGVWWSFLWDGASLKVEDSVRYSALFGLQRTKQLVLRARVAEAEEISWIFTMEER